VTTKNHNSEEEKDATTLNPGSSTESSKLADAEQPLISQRSPSVTRSQKEWANPSETTDPHLIASLCKVVELSQANSATLTAAIGALTNGAEEVSKRADCNRRIAQMSLLISSLGAAAPSADDVDPSLLPFSAKDVEYTDGDDAIREGIARNERLLSEACEGAKAHEVATDLRERIELALLAPISG